MNNKLILTHLWLDGGLLLAKDKNHGFLKLCTEATFNAGPNDSLKKSWKQTWMGDRYREIKRSKQCHVPIPIEWYVKGTDQEEVERSFNRVYRHI